MAKKKRVLITGIAGFLGSHVARECLRNGNIVVGMDDLSGGFIENIPAGVDFHVGDCASVTAVKRIFDEHGPFDTVYHLAAYAAEGLSHFIRNYNYTNNVIASVNLINESIKNNVGCFVFTSSIAVYGHAMPPMTEADIPQPADSYGIAKYAVELDLKAAYSMFGLSYIIFRPHNIFGPNQNIADKYRNVVGIFMNQILRGEPITIFGNGKQTRAFTYVDDVSQIIATAPANKNALRRTFNIGADTPYTVNQLAEEVKRAFDVPDHPVIHLPPRREAVHAFPDHKLVQETFNPPSPVSLRNGIASMAAWVKEHGPMTPVTFDNIEVTRNLPPSWAPTKD